jgi:hypothetical protein
MFLSTLRTENLQSAKANYLVCGFKNGFRIGFQCDRHFRASPNLKSASEFPEIMEEKLAKEISQGRIAGPFHELPFVNLHFSPIGVVPKKEVGQYRLIHHLSYPKDNSINDHIPDELKTVQYSSIDYAIEIILNMGPNLFGINVFFLLKRNTHGIAYFEESFQALITYIFILAT